MPLEYLSNVPRVHVAPSCCSLLFSRLPELALPAICLHAYALSSLSSLPCSRPPLRVPKGGSGGPSAREAQRSAGGRGASAAGGVQGAVRTAGSQAEALKLPREDRRQQHGKPHGISHQRVSWGISWGGSSPAAHERLSFPTRIKGPPWPCGAAPRRIASHHVLITTALKDEEATVVAGGWLPVPPCGDVMYTARPLSAALSCADLELAWRRAARPPCSVAGRREVKLEIVLSACMSCLCGFENVLCVTECAYSY